MADQTQLSEIGTSISETVAAQVGTVTEIAGDAIENAEARAEAAEEVAEVISEAVFRDNLVREIHETKRSVDEWRVLKDQEIGQLSQSMAGIQQSLSSLSEQMALLSGLTLATATGSPAPVTEASLSSPETLAETLTEQLADPTLLSPGDVAESPAAAIQRKVRRLI